MNLTTENLFYMVAAGFALWVLFKLFGPTQPTATPMPPRVTARVIDSVPPLVTPDTVQLLGQLHQMIEAKRIALAFDRKATEMIEQKAKAVDFPWVAPSPAVSDPPKA